MASNNARAQTHARSQISPASGGGSGRRLRVAVLGVDLVVLSTCTVIAIAARTHLPWFDEAHDVVAIVNPLATQIIAAWLILIAYMGGYRQRVFGAGIDEFRRVLNASLATAAGLGVTAYLLQYPLSRGFYFLLFILGIPALLLGRLAVRRVVQRLRAAGYLQHRVVIAGDDWHTKDVLAVLRRETWLGYRVVGLLTPAGRPNQLAPDLPVLGTPAQALLAVQRDDVDTIIFAEGSFSQASGFAQAARDLEQENTDLIVVPALTDISASRTHVRPVAGLPLVHIEKPQAQRSATWRKRLFDIIGSLVLIVLLSPVLVVTAVVIKLQDGGPVLFRQRRVGLFGRTFSCLKFRSMIPNAEAVKADFSKQLPADHVLFKLQDDPRITTFGRFIRRHSIDELPQLFNVLRGEMSLIGPRPALEHEVARYEQHVMRRLDVRPGMTGLWQVSGRSDLSWDDTVRLDLYYVDNWSFLQDLNILLRTFKAVLAPSGAY